MEPEWDDTCEAWAQLRPKIMCKRVQKLQMVRKKLIEVSVKKS